MNKVPLHWIYVTGTPRSGTTFVGRMLSAPLSVDYIHEPFNPDCGIPGITQRFLYLRGGEHHSEEYHQLFRSLFSYRFRLRTGYYPEDPWWKTSVKRVIGSRGPWHLRIAKLNVLHRTAIIKDPIGCLLTPYLALHFPIRPVVLVRHPVTFVASYLRLGWAPDLDALLDQEHLIEDYFPAGPPVVSRDSSSVVDRAALLWRMLNHVLLAEAKANPAWLLRTHEQISLDPERHFRELYSLLNLPWSGRARRLILKQTGGSNPAEARQGRTQDFKRDSRGLFAHRATMLTRDERHVVYSITRDPALQIYSKDSFGLDGYSADTEIFSSPSHA